MPVNQSFQFGNVGKEFQDSHVVPLADSNYGRLELMEDESEKKNGGTPIAISNVSARSQTQWSTFHIYRIQSKGNLKNTFRIFSTLERQLLLYFQRLTLPSQLQYQSSKNVHIPHIVWLQL